MGVPRCPLCDYPINTIMKPSGLFAECTGIKCLYNQRIGPGGTYTIETNKQNGKIMIEPTTKAKTDKVETGLVMVPFNSILRIAGIFVEGLRYGKNNWKKGVNDKEYQEERLEHAMLHLGKWSTGDRTEDHLAKVAWFCVTQMELERLEKVQCQSNT